MRAPSLAVGALGVALCLAAATVDAPSLYVPGVALTLLAAGAATWVELARWGAQLARATGPPTVVEEEPYRLTLTARAGALPPPGGELREPLLGRPVPLRPLQSQRVRIDVRFSRRGRRVLEPATLVIHDPLRLHTRAIVAEAGGELLVLPRTEPVVAADGGGGAGAGGAGGERGRAGRGLDGSAAELDIDGLRPYRPGTPASRIHWPAVARTGEMLERRLVADADSSPLVVLDASNPPNEEALDAAVRAAASLCLHIAHRSACSILLPGERRPVDVAHDLGAWPAVHARLALVRPSKPPAVTRPRSGAVIWVAARRLARIPGPLARTGATARYLVTPNPVAGYPAAFTVAGCTGQRLDQRPATRRAA